MSSSSISKPGGCSGCRQDILRDCDVCLYPGDDGRCLYGPIRKLALAGESAGISIDSMIELLNGGLSLPDLIDYIHSRSVNPCANVFRKPLS